MQNKTIAITIGLCCLLSPALKAEEQLTILKGIYTGGNVQRDVTPVLIKQVRGGRVQFDVSNGPLGGDPCFGKVKTLTVIYRNASGDFTITASEGERLIIPDSKALPLSPANRTLENQAPANNSSESSLAESKQTASPRLAPDGVYYLLERVNARIDGGLIGFPPGTKVERVSDSISTLRVKVGDQEFEVSKCDLTNDLDIAAGKQQTEQSRRTTQQQTMATQQQAAQREMAAQQQAAQREMAGQQQADAENKAKAEKFRQGAANAKRIHGTILQATGNGLLIDNHFVDTSPSYGMQSIGGGGGYSGPPDPNGKGRPPAIDGVFWIVGHPKQNSKVDKDSIDVDAYEDGIYEYVAVSGAAKRIKKYQVIKWYE